MAEILYPDEGKESVKRHSSIDQFECFLSAWKQGGWAPIVFDKIDSIGTCSGIKSHPVAISWGDDLGYIYPEGRCTYESDKWVTVDKQGVEQKPLPECFGGDGEFYDAFVDKRAFLNFDTASALGTHNKKSLRVGLSYVKANQTLPPVE